MSKLAKMLSCCSLVSTVCLFFSGISAKVEAFAQGFHPGTPFSSVSIPRHPFEFAAQSRGLACIGPILGMGAWSYICSLIIESVPVSVIKLASFGQPSADCNFSVQFDSSPVTISPRRTPDGIPQVARFGWSPLRGPLPLHRPIVINVIYKGDFALGERYNFHGSVLSGSALFTRLADPLLNNDQFLRGNQV